MEETRPLKVEKLKVNELGVYLKRLSGVLFY